MTNDIFLRLFFYPENSLLSFHANWVTICMKCQTLFSEEKKKKKKKKNEKKKKKNSKCKIFSMHANY